MAFTSITDWALTLNGHTVNGLSDDRGAIQFPEIDRLLTQYSAEGRMLQTLSGMKGGIVIITLQADSPSIKVLGGWVTAMVNDIVVPITGSARNTRWGISAALTGGQMKAGPGFLNWGSGIPPNPVFRIAFEKILPNYSGQSVGAGTGQFRI